MNPIQRVVRPLAAAALAVWVAMPVLAQSPAGDIVLVIDNSGSMRKNDPRYLGKEAVSRFIAGVSGDTRVAVIIFGEKVDLAVPLTDVTAATRDAVLASLTRVDYAGQFTNSPAAIERAIYELKTNGRATADKSVIFLTDGIVDTGNAARDVESARWMREDLAAEAADAGIRIFGIAFTDQADFQLIQSVARKTGAEYFRAYTPEDLSGVFERVNELLSARPVAPVPAVPSASAPALPSAPAMPPATLPELPSVAEGQLPALPADSTATPAPEGPALPEVPTLPDAPALPDALPPVETAAPAVETVVAPAPEPAQAPSPAPEPPKAASAPAPAPPPAPVPAPVPEGIPVSWMAGAALALLVLVALIVVVLRRGSTTAPAAPSRPPAFLTDMEAVTGKVQHDLAGDVLMVGRMKASGVSDAEQLVIEKSTIGRRHAVIEYRDHAYWVTDQNSLNGTFVNGQRIAAPTQLKHGDRLRFHDTEFVFGMPGMEESDRTVLAGAQPVDADRTRVGRDRGTTGAVPATASPDAAGDEPDAPESAEVTTRPESMIDALARESEPDEDFFDLKRELEAGEEPGDAAPAPARPRSLIESYAEDDTAEDTPAQLEPEPEPESEPAPEPPARKRESLIDAYADSGPDEAPPPSFGSTQVWDAAAPPVDAEPIADEGAGTVADDAEDDRTRVWDGADADSSSEEGDATKVWTGETGEPGEDDATKIWKPEDYEGDADDDSTQPFRRGRR